MTAKEKRKQEAIERLREIVNPGDELRTVLRHASRSGMQRQIDVYKIEGGEARYLTAWVADALDYRQAQGLHGPLKVNGCGMDMGYHVVYSLARTLWPDSFDCVGEGCPSNDHSNGDRDYSPHRHSDGGYALRQRWL